MEDAWMAERCPRCSGVPRGPASLARQDCARSTCAVNRSTKPQRGPKAAALSSRDIPQGRRATRCSAKIRAAREGLNNNWEAHGEEERLLACPPDNGDNGHEPVQRRPNNTVPGDDRRMRLQRGTVYAAWKRGEPFRNGGYQSRSCAGAEARTRGGRNSRYSSLIYAEQ